MTIETNTSPEPASASRRWRLRPAEFLLLVCLILSVTALLLHVFIYFRTDFNSDEASFSLLAEEIRVSGSPYPSTWIYNNGDLFVPSAVLLLVALLQGMPNGFAAHGLTSALVVLITLGVFLWFLWKLRIHGFAVLWISVFLATGISSPFARFVFDQTFYATWPVAFMIVAVILMVPGRNFQEASSRVWLKSLILFLLSFLLTLNNPQRVLFLLFIPLAAFAFFWRLPEDQGRSFCRNLLSGIASRLKEPDILSALVLGPGAGVLVYKVLIEPAVTIRMNAANLKLAEPSDILANLQVLTTGWLPFLGGSAEALEMNTLLGSGAAHLRLLVALGMTVSPLVVGARLARRADRPRKATLMAFLASFLSVMLILVFTTPLARSGLCLRYFTVGLFLLFILAAFAIEDIVTSRSRSPVVARWLLVALALGLTAGSWTRQVPGPARLERPVLQAPRTHRDELIEYLLALNRDCGLATFWHANVTTVLSEQRLLVRPIMLTPFGPAPFPYHVSRRWFRDGSCPGPSFVLLSKSELKTVDLLRFTDALGPPTDQVWSGRYLVLLYDRSISNLLADSSRHSGSDPITDFRAGIELNSQLAAPDLPLDGGILPVRFKNLGGNTFPTSGPFFVEAGISLRDQRGDLIDRNWKRHRLPPGGLAPGQSVELNIPLPPLPRGHFRIHVDLVQEGVTWFEAKGNGPLVLAVRAAGRNDYTILSDERISD